MSSPNYTYHHDRPTIWAGDTLPEIFFRILDDEDNAIPFTEVCAEIRNRHGEVVWKYKPIYEADGRVGLPAVPSKQTMRMTDFLYTYSVSYKGDDGKVVSYIVGNIYVRSPYNRNGYGSGGFTGSGGSGSGGSGNGTGNGGTGVESGSGGLGEGLSAYEVALKNGFKGTEEEWLASLMGKNGLSAYEVALKHGFNGTEQEWLESLKGMTTLVERELSEIPEYDPSKIYRKGDIVRIELTLYAALKTVPRNTPPPNDEFWNNLGTFESYIDILNSLVTRVDKNAGTIEQISKLQVEMSTGLADLERGLQGNASAISKLETRVKLSEDGITAQSKQLSELNSSIEVVADDLRIVGGKLEMKADSNALQELSTKVEQQGNDLLAQSDATTKLANELSIVGDNLDTKASSEALQKLESEVRVQGESITSQNSAITELHSTIGAIPNAGVNLAGYESAVTFEPEGVDLSAVKSEQLEKGNGYTETDAAIKYTVTEQYEPAIIGYAKGVGQCARVVPSSEYIMSVYVYSELPRRIQMYGAAAASESKPSWRNIYPVAGSQRFVEIEGGSWTRVSVAVRTSRVAEVLSFIMHINEDGYEASPENYVLFSRFMIERKLSNNLEPSSWTVGVIDNVVVGNSDALKILETQVTQHGDKLTALSREATKLSSDITDVDNKATANAEGISELVVKTEKNAQGLVSQSNRSDRLEASIGDLDSKKADATYVKDVEVKVEQNSKGIESTASELSKLGVTVGKNTSAISTEAKARADADTALSNRVDSVKASTDKNAADIKSESTARADADGALSKQISSVTATLRTEIEESTKRTTVLDTRDTNQNPDWYWKNYPKTIVEEFKKASVLGLTGFGTYVNLETRVYYGDSTGGPIIQIAHAANKPANTVQRSSKSGTEWDNWGSIAQELSAAVQTETTARVSADNALGQRIDSVKAIADTNTAAVQAESKARADGEKALATSINRVEANLNGTIDDLLSAPEITANSRLLWQDTTFLAGVNGVSSYDNASTGRVNVNRVARASDNPTTSTHQLNVTISAGAAPSYGGFYQNINGRANAIFVIKYTLKLPVGYTINTASNSMGTGYTDKFVGNDKGTGKYETYTRVVRCGATGTFSTGGHVHFSGTALTGTQTLVIPLAKIECYDVSDAGSGDEKILASVEEVKNAQATLEGKVNAEWGVNLVANSKGQYVVAGIKAGVNNNSGVLQSAIIMQAQQFTIQDGANGAGTTPFQVVGGVVRMNAAVIGDATITMAKIGGDLYSTNFVAGVSGWRLQQNGNFEINSTVAGEGRVEINNKGVRVYDANGNIRVKLGDLR